MSAARFAGACVIGCLAVGMGVVTAVPASAQGQPRETPKVTLSEALVRLNQNPRDTQALIAAGNAALAAGDTDAAVGFFTRADRLLPDNPRIEAGLAGAEVRAEDPFSAIPLFAAAERSGPIPPEWLADRGLAYDLVGDNVSAQRYYNQALANGASDEVIRRLALSLAISGDRRASETVLAPVLQKRDRAGWRTRIFALAILGYEEEAVTTAKSTMPPDMALEIAPYLRYMRQLTPAQQAAAANLGHFPQASEIGHDDPRVAQYARAADRSRLASADRGLIPAGAPLGRAQGSATADQTDRRHKGRVQGPDVAQLASASTTTGHETRTPLKNSAPPELTVSRVTQAPAPSVLAVTPALVSAPAPIRLISPATSAVPETRVAVAPSPQALFPASTVPPAFKLSASTPPEAAVPAPQPAPVPATAPAVAPRPHVVEAPAARPSFAEAFAALGPVVVDTAPARGAVDLRKIKPARAVPKPPPPPPPPSHPSRIWVELGVGRDTDRLGFDWHRMVKDDPEIFKGKKPFVSSWARTNRLLVGPFETDKAANSFTDKLHKADHPSAFVWTSPAGQVVDPLDGE